MKTLRLLVGTYEESKGIWDVRLNLQNRQVLSCKCVSDTRRNSYLVQQGEFCYAVSEIPLAEGAVGELHSFRITEDGLEPISHMGGLPPLLPHLCVNREGSVLYTASYGTGEILAVSLCDGVLVEILCHTLNKGSSVNPKRQTCAHPHSVWLDPEQKHLYLCDLGTDEVLSWPLEEDGTLRVAEKKILRVPAGYGPRHMAFSPCGRFVYVLCEMAYHVLVLRRTEDGTLQLIRDVALGADIPAEEQSGGAIRLLGKTLYCSNRGKNTSRIDVLALDIPDCPIPRQKPLTDCMCPRDFALAAGEDILVCGNQTADTLSIFRKNDAQNTMEYFFRVSGVPKPVCIVMLEK